MSTRVLIADDSEIMRSAIRRMLEEEAKIDVVGEAENFAKTIQMVGDHRRNYSPLGLPATAATRKNTSGRNART